MRASWCSGGVPRPRLLRKEGDREHLFTLGNTTEGVRPQLPGDALDALLDVAHAVDPAIADDGHQKRSGDLGVRLVVRDHHQVDEAVRIIHVTGLDAGLRIDSIHVRRHDPYDLLHEGFLRRRSEEVSPRVVHGHCGHYCPLFRSDGLAVTSL